MKSALRKQTSDFADLVDALADVRKSDPREPGEFTAREYANSLGISDQTARYQLRALADAGKLRVRTAVNRGRSTNLYRRR